MQKDTNRLPRTLIHPMSKRVYAFQLLGICTKFMRTFLFNLLMLFVGITIGMGFAIIHVQKAWKDKCSRDAIFKIEQQLHQYGIEDEDIVKMFMNMKNKQHRKTKKPSK